MLVACKSEKVEKESELASILLSLSSTVETEQPKRLKLKDQQCIQTNRLPSFDTLLNPIEHCSFCFGVNKYCMFCNSANWTSCISLLHTHLPHLVSQFTPSSMLENHAQQFILSKGLYSHNYGGLTIPPTFYQEYLNSVEHFVRSPAYKAEMQRNLRVAIPSNNTASSLPSPAYSTKCTFSRKRSLPSIYSPVEPQQATICLPTPKDAQDEGSPRCQPPRWENDCYTPRWVRYSGSKKEGLCEMCEPNRWLQLKDSAFWYHKQFFHGISSSTGVAFASPVCFRTVWNAVATNDHGVSVNLMTEGKCHQCLQWIPLFKNKKRFSHYFPTIQQVKDTFMKSDGMFSAAELLGDEPISILAARTQDGNIYIPPAVNISNAVLYDVSSHESGKMSAVWWRHAHKCHSNTPNR